MQKNNKIKKWIGQILLWSVVLFSSQSGMAYSAPKTVLVLGDSLSAEYGLARGTGWVALLVQRLQDKNLDVDLVNASISGETTSGGAARIGDLLKKHHPGIVIVELGGNDGLRGLPLDAALQNFRTIITVCKNAHASVLLVGMQIPPNYGRSYTDRFTAMYPTLAKEMHIPLVPFLLEGVADKPDLFQADHIHVSAAAHPRLLDNVWPSLYALLKPLL